MQMRTRTISYKSCGQDRVNTQFPNVR